MGFPFRKCLPIVFLGELMVMAYENGCKQKCLNIYSKKKYRKLHINCKKGLSTTTKK